jgi:hypothetical protein
MDTRTTYALYGITPSTGPQLLKRIENTLTCADKKWGGLCIFVKKGMYLEDNSQFITGFFSRLRRLE